MSDTLEIFGQEYTNVAGIKATDDNDQIKTYIRPQGTKSISANGTGIDVTAFATVDVSVPTPAPTIDSLSVTPSETQQTYNSSSVDGYKPVTVGAISSTYVGSGITRRGDSDLYGVYDDGEYHIGGESGYYAYPFYKSVPNGTAGTPTATKVIDRDDVAALVTPSVTNSAGYISGGTHTGSSVVVTPRELVSGLSATADDAGAWDVANLETLVVPSGTAGTPTATKGTVSNHSVTVTPSVTNSTGYITGGTKTGTGVSVSASELVSGNLAITENGTNIDVTNYATVSVAVEGGGGSAPQVDKVIGGPYESSTLTFTGLKGEPIAYYVSIDSTVSTGATAKAVALVYDGTTIHGETLANQITYSNAFTHSYSNGTLTITGTGVSFQSDEHVLVYAYGGSSANIDTKDVQVGSGATSITFTGLDDEPIAWSCIFKSDFGTSSGYQRVVFAGYDTEYDRAYGMEMDSSAKTALHWTASYSNGSLTITSNGTNQGGYFHQPGYYQLTAIYGEASPYQAKTVTPTTSTQVIEADSDYEALSRVTVNPIPSEYVVPSGNLAITQNGNNINVSQYATVSVNVSGGSSDVATGTLNVASNVNTSTSTTIATTSTIGFTPTKFFFWKTERTATNNHVHQATFTTLGSNYIRTMTRYSSNALSTSGNTNSWTTQTAGYLYFNSNTVYFRSSSSYILSAGTWNWVAVK